MVERLVNHMPGDILFYASVPNDVVDMAIADWTGSPLVHTAIAISALQKIEAIANGVMLTPIVGRNVAKWWSYVDHVQLNERIHLNDALNWLHGMLGQPYGYGDILEAFLWKFQHGVIVDIGDHFDCSALACEFLMKAGGVPALSAITNPHEVTPVMLASLLGAT